MLAFYNNIAQRYLEYPYILQKIMLIYFTNKIFIDLDDQELASMLKASGELKCFRVWEVNPVCFQAFQTHYVFRVLVAKGFYRTFLAK